MNMHYELNEKHDFDTFDSMSMRNMILIPLIL